MTGSRTASFFRCVPWLYGAAIAGAAVEVAVAGHRATSGVFSLTRVVVAFSGAQVFAAALLAVVALVATGLRAGERRLRAARLYDPGGRFRRVDFAAAALVTLPVTVALGGAVIVSFIRNFRNRELAALLAAAVVLAIAAVAIVATGLLGLALHGARRRLEGTRPRLAFASWLPGAAVIGGLLGFDRRAHVTGASQLDVWLVAPPLAAVIGALVLRRPWAARALAVRCAPGLALATALGLAAFSALSSVSVSSELASYGAWSRPMIPALRAFTDFDGDGYSALFEGGDCNDSDASVNPRAVERPGNGIDDNCLGGDGQLSPVEPPKPSGIRIFDADAAMNLVLVTIETLRADRVSFLGYSRPTTPRLAELAKTSVVFERLYANTPTTRLSLPSLLSGTLASRIDWRLQAPEKHMRRIGPRTPWLPELLRADGYSTIAVHASFRAFTELESAGFDRGFDRYDVATRLVYRGGTMHGFPGQEQIDRALSFIDGVSALPFFLWVHLLEPHYLYEQSPQVPRFGTSEHDLYDAEIAEADRHVGRLVDGLSQRGLLERSIVLVTGDHGEEFGEHGERWHTSNLYDPQLHTAGLLRVPGLEARRLRTPVVLTDFAPTLLDLLGKTRALARMQGRNLVPLLRSGDRPLPPFFVENFRVNDGRAYQAGVISWPYKLIYREDGGLLELYDVQRDPAERDNLYDRDPAVGHELLGLIHRLRESSALP